MRHFIFALLLVGVVFFGAAVLAQNEADCDTSELAKLLSDQAQAVERGELDGLGDLIAAISQTQAECDGFVFAGTGNAVLGPLEFEDGFYRIALDVETFGGASFETVDGDCGLLLLTVFEMDGGIDNAAEEFEDCRLLVEIDTGEDWTLTFSRVD